MSTALQKITTRAKQMKRTHPNTAWVTLVKKASAEYRGGSLGKAKAKSRPAKRKSKSKRHSTGSPVAAAAVGSPSTSMSFHKREMKKALEHALASQTVRLFNAKKVRYKRAIAKEIAQTKRELRKYC